MTQVEKGELGTLQKGVRIYAKGPAEGDAKNRTIQAKQVLILGKRVPLKELRYLFQTGEIPRPSGK